MFCKAYLIYDSASSMGTGIILFHHIVPLQITSQRSISVNSGVQITVKVPKPDKNDSILESLGQRAVTDHFRGTNLVLLMIQDPVVSCSQHLQGKDIVVTKVHLHKGRQSFARTQLAIGYHKKIRIISY